VNGNVKLGHAAARSGEWAQHFSNASCSICQDHFQSTTIANSPEKCTSKKEIHRSMAIKITGKIIGQPGESKMPS